MRVLANNGRNVIICPTPFLHPSRYEKDDIVLFHPVRMQKSGSSSPAVLHLEKPRPYIFMDDSCLSAFNIRPGRM